MNRRTWLWAAAASSLVLGACDKNNPAPTDAAPAVSVTAQPATADAAPAPGAVTILVTADENGYLLPQDPAKKGGAAQILGVWKTEDHQSRRSRR